MPGLDPGIHALRLANSGDNLIPIADHWADGPALGHLRSADACATMPPDEARQTAAGHSPEEKHAKSAI